MVKRQNKQLVQIHHISYDPEITVKIYKGEHWALTQLNRRTKNVSRGFLECLKDFIKRSEPIAVDLEL